MAGRGDVAGRRAFNGRISCGRGPRNKVLAVLTKMFKLKNKMFKLPMDEGKEKCSGSADQKI